MNKNILVTGIEGFIGSNFALQAKKSNFNVKDIVPYIIINDPENFINSPYA